MVEERENKVSGLGEAWNRCNTEFMQEFERVLNRMTEEDWCKLNDQLKQMKEQKTGLYAYAILNENSDNTSKLKTEVSEGVSESKIVEVVALDNKILNNDNCEIKMGVNGNETD